MKLLTKSIREHLLRNGRIQEALAEDGRAEADFIPVVKLFTPDANCTWLLTELFPDSPDLATGLCDLGMGFPELGSVRISELESVRGALGLPVERDRHFNARHTLSVYARAAHRAQVITECPNALRQAAEEAAEKAGQLDLDRFDDVEIMPVRHDPEHGACEPVPDAPNTASVWTVYGHLKEGGVEAVIDCADEASADSAAFILRQALRLPPLLAAAGEAASVLRWRKAIAYDRCARELEALTGSSQGGES